MSLYRHERTCLNIYRQHQPGTELEGRLLAAAELVVKFVNNKVTAAFERLYPGETFEAHNALGDAEALYKILLRRKKHESHFIDLTSEILGGAI